MGMAGQGSSGCGTRACGWRGNLGKPGRHEGEEGAVLGASVPQERPVGVISSEPFIHSFTHSLRKLLLKSILGPSLGLGTMKDTHKNTSFFFFESLQYTRGSYKGQFCAPCPPRRRWQYLETFSAVTTMGMLLAFSG